MILTLDHTFHPSDLLDWYQHAAPGAVSHVHVPAMDNWLLTIIKSPEPRRVIVLPEGHQPGAVLFSELLVTLQDIQHGLAARAHPTA